MLLNENHWENFYSNIKHKIQMPTLKADNFVAYMKTRSHYKHMYKKEIFC